MPAVRALLSRETSSSVSRSSPLQSLDLTADPAALGTGQYTKLPPVATLIVQSLGTVVGAILQLIIMKVRGKNKACFTFRQLMLCLPAGHRRGAAASPPLDAGLEHLVRTAGPVFQLPGSLVSCLRLVPDPNPWSSTADAFPSAQLGRTRQELLRPGLVIRYHPLQYPDRSRMRECSLAFRNSCCRNPDRFLVLFAQPLPFYILHRFFPKAGFNTYVTPVTLWCLGACSPPQRWSPVPRACGLLTPVPSKATSLSASTAASS